MSSRQDIPHYADYKEFIAEAYPEVAMRIAISQRGIPKKRKTIEADLRSQLPEEVISVIPAAYLSKHLDSLESALLLRVGRLSSFNAHIMPFFKSRDERDSFQFFYMMIQADKVDPIKWFHAFSNLTVPSARMKFNQAAVDPAALHWFSFFHELCHILIMTGIQPSGPYGTMDNISLQKYDPASVQYFRSRDETICDTFAAVQLLKMMGERAIPVIRTIADMRLSKLPFSGHDYFTGLAMREVVKKAERNGIEELRSTQRDILHAYVLMVSRENYFSKEDFSILHPTYEIVNDRDSPVSINYRKDLATRAIEKVLESKLTAEEGTYDRKIADECIRAFGLIEREYSYASSFDKIVERLRQAFTGGEFRP